MDVQPVPSPTPVQTPASPPAPSPHKVNASKQKRADGRFVKIEEDPTGDELVDLKVHNPVKWVYAQVDYFRKHGGIRIDFHTTIPPAAILLIGATLMGVTGLIRVIAPVCPTKTDTRIGQLYTLAVAPTIHRPFSFLGFSLTGNNPETKSMLLTVLREADRTFTLHINPSGGNTTLHGQTVAVTGEVNPCDNVLTTTLQNITPLPAKP